MVAPAALPTLAKIEQVLQLQSGSLAPCLTKRKMKAGANWVQADIVLQAAIDGRDALARAIYSRLFDHLIAQINAALLASSSPMDKDDRVIGVVDIFGFEFYDTNSLEQLCINFTNEKLQQVQPHGGSTAGPATSSFAHARRCCVRHLAF